MLVGFNLFSFDGCNAYIFAAFDLRNPILLIGIWVRQILYMELALGVET